MAFKQLTVIRTDIDQVDRLQRATKEFTDQLVSRPSLDRQVISAQLKSGQLNRVDHGLGRKLVGWVVCSKNAAADLWDKQDANKSPNLKLDLMTTADVSVSIEVF